MDFEESERLASPLLRLRSSTICRVLGCAPCGIVGDITKGITIRTGKIEMKRDLTLTHLYDTVDSLR